MKEFVRYVRTGNATICFLSFEKGPGFIGKGVHENPEKAQEIAYQDAKMKSQVISFHRESAVVSFMNRVSRRTPILLVIA
jgi:hypothetical protein